MAPRRPSGVPPFALEPWHLPSNVKARSTLWSGPWTSGLSFYAHGKGEVPIDILLFKEEGLGKVP